MRLTLTGCRGLASFVGVLAALSLVGCGGGESVADESEAAPGPVTFPACAPTDPAQARPRELPTGFPLPPGTRITVSSTPHPGQLLVAGLVPAELDHAARFFDEELHAQGYRLGRGDAEQGEVEAPFTGNGYRGKWQVNSVVECPDTVRLTLVLIRQA
jgi:hypothetical protein